MQSVIMHVGIAWQIKAHKPEMLVTSGLYQKVSH